MELQDQTVDQLLQAGVAAAKAGQHTRARALLARVLALDAGNVTAWLWLSGVAETPLQQEACLEKALALDPGNQPAQKALIAARARATAYLLQEGVAAAQAGNSGRARELLMQVTARDEENLPAWLWLSRVVDSSEDQETCYENILALDPDNVEAQKGVTLLRQVREAAAANPWVEVADADLDDRQRAAPTLAAAVLGEEYVRRHTTVIPEPEPEPESPAVALWARFEDEYRCPYCAAPTGHDHRRCKACGNPLWIKVQRKEERSTLLWILILLQAGYTVFSSLGPILTLYFVSERVGLDDFTQLLPVYFGLPGSVSPQASAALAMAPRGVFFLSWVPFLVSSALTVGLYLRWPLVFYLLLIDAGLGLLGSVVALVVFLSAGLIAIFGGVIGVLLSLGLFVLVLKLEDDFKRDKIRILLRADRDIKEGMAFLIRGRLYASKKMWALAAIHFRRAAALMAHQPDGYLAMAIACINLKEYDLAAYALEDVRRVNPEDPEIDKLEALLAKSRSEVAT